MFVYLTINKATSHSFKKHNVVLLTVWYFPSFRKHVGPDLEQHLWFDDSISRETQPGCDWGDGQPGECVDRIPLPRRRDLVMLYVIFFFVTGLQCYTHVPCGWGVLHLSGIGPNASGILGWVHVGEAWRSRGGVSRVRLGLLQPQRLQVKCKKPKKEKTKRYILEPVTTLFIENWNME